MITLAFRGSADTTKQPQTKPWQETYPESGSDEEKIRLNHWRSKNSSEWPGRTADSKGKTSWNDSADRGSEKPHIPKSPDNAQTSWWLAILIFTFIHVF